MNLEELDSLYAKSTPPDWRTRAEVDFFTALWDSYPALRDRLRALEDALRDVRAIQDEYDSKPNLIPVAGWYAIRERLAHGDLAALDKEAQ